MSGSCFSGQWVVYGFVGNLFSFADESNPYDKISIHKDFGIQYGRVVSRTQALTIGVDFTSTADRCCCVH
ncbi:MAG: hypothetical protein R2825_14830 [Saprospiraceae bacterium]